MSSWIHVTYYLLHQAVTVRIDEKVLPSSLSGAQLRNGGLFEAVNGLTYLSSDRVLKPPDYVHAGNSSASTSPCFSENLRKIHAVLLPLSIPTFLMGNDFGFEGKNLSSSLERGFSASLFGMRVVSGPSGTCVTWQTLN